MGDITVTVERYATAKGMIRFRGQCQACGARFAGKYYPLQVVNALKSHHCSK